MQPIRNLRRFSKVSKFGHNSVFFQFSHDGRSTFRAIHSFLSVSPHQNNITSFSPLLSPHLVGVSDSEKCRQAYFLGAKNAFSSSNELSSSSPGAFTDSPTEAVKEICEKIMESVNSKRTMSPNSWLWTLINVSQNREDIKLLFDALENLRRFRLSNLRIHENFNCHVCLEVVKSCVRSGAIDFGKKALWKHNVYGLTPTVGSVNQLLFHAKNQKDPELLVDVMKLVSKNDIELHPSTADAVFSACCEMENWELISKYSKKFIRAGVKLRKTSFDSLMNFAAKRADTSSLWKIEELRSKTVNRHTIFSAFACAKGLIVDGRPEEAAAVVLAVHEVIPEEKRGDFEIELRKLVNNWPSDVAQFHSGDEQKNIIAVLKTNIPIMVSALVSAVPKMQIDGSYSQ